MKNWTKISLSSVGLLGAGVGLALWSGARKVWVEPSRSVACWGFYPVYGWLLNGKFWLGWAFLPFLLPAILFLAYWVFTSLSLSHKKENLSH